MKPKNNNSYHKLPILDGLELLDARNHTINFPFHTHGTFNITLVLEQTFSTKLTDDRFLQAPVGTIVITNPQEVHSTFCDNKVGSSFFTFYLSPDVLEELHGNKPVFFNDKTITDKLLFQQLYHLSQNYAEPGFEVERKLVHALKLLVKKYASEIVAPRKENKLFKVFLEEETLDDKFSLERSAQQFGLDKFKFLRLFKQQTGLTPNNYIILKRIEKSKELLQTQSDLLDIAIQTGFYDATHLCKHFKKITGITPLAYHKA